MVHEELIQAILKKLQSACIREIGIKGLPVAHHQRTVCREDLSCLDVLPVDNLRSILEVEAVMGETLETFLYRCRGERCTQFDPYVFIDDSDGRPTLVVGADICVSLIEDSRFYLSKRRTGYLPCSASYYSVRLMRDYLRANSIVRNSLLVDMCTYACLLDCACVDPEFMYLLTNNPRVIDTFFHKVTGSDLTFESIRELVTVKRGSVIPDDLDTLCFQVVNGADCLCRFTIVQNTSVSVEIALNGDSYVLSVEIPAIWEGTDNVSALDRNAATYNWKMFCNSSQVNPAYMLLQMLLIMAGIRLHKNGVSSLRTLGEVTTLYHPDIVNISSLTELEEYDE